VVASTATSLRRGLAILFALADENAAGNGHLGVVRIAELVGREKSQVSRSLQTLAEYGIVERDPASRGYRLGWRLFALAAQAGEPRLLDAATPVITRLVATLGERAHLSVLEGAEVLTLLSEGPTHAVQTAGWIGRSAPAYCTASGRALLLDHDASELRSLFASTPFEGFGPDCPRNVDELADRIRKARVRGYAAVDEEFEPGLVAVAAPLRNFGGRIVAALNVSAPKFRFGARLDSAGAEVRAAADELSRELGRR
jgi:IclR family KDG regulon transcriptional repressor